MGHAHRVIVFTKLNPNAQEPRKGYDGDAGFDLFVATRTVIPPGAVVDVDHGIAAAFPPGMWGRICGRSSTIRKRGLLAVEGIIDNGYTGSLFACVYNFGTTEVVVEPGERLVQLIPHDLVPTLWTEADELPKTQRGAAGFGSSGR